MSSPLWERAIVFAGAVVFVLIWIVKNVDLANLEKWRDITRPKGGNWTILTQAILAIIVLVAAYCVYWVLIHRLS